MRVSRIDINSEIKGLVTAEVYVSHFLIPKRSEVDPLSRVRSIASRCTAYTRTNAQTERNAHRDARKCSLGPSESKRSYAVQREELVGSI